MHHFFQKHCKSATLLKERGSADNVPAAPEQPASAAPAKDGVHQAAPLSKQQKKKRRQQKKSTQASSPSRSQSPVREPASTDSGPTDRLAQPPTAQDQSTPTQQSDTNISGSSNTDSLSNNPSRAASPVEDAAEEPPSDQQRADAAKDEGNVQYKAGRYEAALAAYGRAISICPDTPAYYGNRAAAALMKRDYKLAVQDSLHATKLNSDFARGYQRAGQCHKSLVLSQQPVICWSECILLPFIDYSSAHHQLTVGSYLIHIAVLRCTIQAAAVSAAILCKCIVLLLHAHVSAHHVCISGLCHDLSC